MDCTNNQNHGKKYMKSENRELNIVYGDSALGVHGERFSYIFSYSGGGLESLVIDGKEWLYRAPKPTFWRALTDNDRGNKFHLRSGMWLAADMFINCVGAHVQVDGKEIGLPIAPANNDYAECDSEKQTAKKVAITFIYETITIPSTRVTVCYEVNTQGQIKVEVHYQGNDALPELPVFGMRFIMPTKAVFYRYEGLSGETYPDRMAGGIPGVYEVEGLPVTKYLVPQDCQVHMETKWLEVYRNRTLSNVDKKVASSKITGYKKAEEEDVFSLRFSAVDKNFAFSCIPYTAEELENATHMEELPPARRTVVSILGAVRGVGGINTWGADVEPAYHIDAGKDMKYSFVIEIPGAEPAHCHRISS